MNATATARADSNKPLHSDPKFAQRHPLQIGGCLRKLVQSKDFVTVEFDGRQIVTQLRDVDLNHLQFVFDAANATADNRALTGAQELIFQCTPGGVPTQFSTENALPVTFEDRPAYQVRFPSVLYYVQRREYFRVTTPLLDPYLAQGSHPDGAPFTLEMQDLSVGGVALRTDDARFDALPAGTTFRDVVLHLGKFGDVRLDLEVIHSRLAPTSRRNPRYVLGCRFISTPGSTERTLQRAITGLEKRRSALAPH